MSPVDRLHAAIVAARPLTTGLRRFAGSAAHVAAARELAEALDAAPWDFDEDRAYALGEATDAYEAGEFRAALRSVMDRAAKRVVEDADDDAFEWGDDGRAFASDRLDGDAADAEHQAAADWLHAAWLVLDGMAGRIVMESVA